eukprot:gene10253-18947_t
MQGRRKHELQLRLLFKQTLIALLMIKFPPTNTASESSDVEKDLEIIYPSLTHMKSGASQHAIQPSLLEQFTIHFRAFNKTFNARMNTVNNFIAPRTVWSMTGTNANSLKPEHPIVGFYKGKLTDDAKSFVSLSKGNGMEGIIFTETDQYLIKPMQKLGLDGAHVIIKRMLPKIRFHHNSNKTSTKIQDSPKVRKKRNAGDASIEKTVETLLVIDQKMAQHYGLDAARQYALTVGNIAHDILRDASIGPNSVNMVIVKVLVLVASQENLIINHHAHNTLASFGKWAWQQSKQLEAKGEGFDYAILLTRYDICKDIEQPCDYNGASYTGGMCRFPSSVAVIQDHGLITGFSIAHHIGHSLGMEHDMIGTSCFAQNRVMKPNAGYGEGAFLWSSCSVNHLQKFLRTEQSHCLNDAPSKKRQDSVTSFPNSGTVYDIVSQCELFGGEGAKGCYFGDIDEVCVELQCILPNMTSCVRTGKPPADGTACGEDKWCKHGRCVEQRVADASVVDGGWSSWGEFKQCSRPCGGGIAYRERTCHNPVALRGGKYCEGDSKEYTICNKKPCPDSVMNFRKQQCKRHSGSFEGDIQYNWTYNKSNGRKGKPMESSCMLECVAENNRKILKNFGRSIDGTDCYLFDENLAGKCVAGECMSVGCDMELGSKEKVDRCGVCKGDGGSCREKFVAKLQNPAAVFVNVTDRKANRTKSFHNTGNVTAFINATVAHNMTDAGSRSINETNKNTTNFETAKTKGGNVNNSTGVDHLLNALRKLKALRKLMKAVLQKKCSQDAKCLERYKFFDLKHKKSEITRPKSFEWVTVSTGCSVTCGIGTKSLYPECRRVDDGSPVGLKFCSILPRPVSRVRACKMPSCTAKWVASDWQSCTKSCDAGIQSREIFCIKTISEEFLVPDSLCNSEKKPAAKRICNKQACPSKWITEPFGKCSTTCGRGVQLREVFCKSYVQNTGFAIVPDSRCKPIERPQRELICNAHNPCPGEGNCGGNITGLHGSFSSPNYPNHYPNNKECLSQVTVPDGKVVRLQLTETAAIPMIVTVLKAKNIDNFVFEYSLKLNGTRKSESACEGDFLRIIDGKCGDPVVKSFTLFCGNEVSNASIVSTTNTVCVKFFSDDYGTSKGFSIQYVAIDSPGMPSKIVDICDANTKLIKSSFGALTSPNYPEAYPANEYCKVTVSAMDKSGFIIAMKGFNVGSKGESNQCEDDFLEFYHDGISEKLCGRQDTQEATIKSDSFTLVFRSGNAKVGGTGFVMTFITKKVLRLQLAQVKKKKQELAYKQKHTPLKTIVLPVVTDKAAASLNPAKGHGQVLVEALTNLKKSNISQQRQSSSGDAHVLKHINNQAMLTSVLNILGGGIETKESKKQQITHVISEAQRYGAGRQMALEDYTKADARLQNTAHTHLMGSLPEIFTAVLPRMPVPKIDSIAYRKYGTGCEQRGW